MIGALNGVSLRASGVSLRSIGVSLRSIGALNGVSLRSIGVSLCSIGALNLLGARQLFAVKQISPHTPQNTPNHRHPPHLKCSASSSAFRVLATPSANLCTSLCWCTLVANWLSKGRRSSRSLALQIALSGSRLTWRSSISGSPHIPIASASASVLAAADSTQFCNTVPKYLDFILVYLLLVDAANVQLGFCKPLQKQTRAPSRQSSWSLSPCLVSQDIWLHVP